MCAARSPPSAGGEILRFDIAVLGAVVVVVRARSLHSVLSNEMAAL